MSIKSRSRFNKLSGITKLSPIAESNPIIDQKDELTYDDSSRRILIEDLSSRRRRRLMDDKLLSEQKNSAETKVKTFDSSMNESNDSGFGKSLDASNISNRSFEDERSSDSANMRSMNETSVKSADFNLSSSGDKNKIGEKKNSFVTVNVEDGNPNELNISVECIADFLKDDLNQQLKIDNELLTKQNEEFKMKIVDLEHKKLQLDAENRLLQVKFNELEHQYKCLDNAHSKQMVQNIDLAKSLQDARLKIRENENDYFQLSKEFYEQFDMYDKYHKHHVYLTNFFDMYVKKIGEIDTSLNLICEKRFDNFPKQREHYMKITTFDDDAIHVLGAYLKKIQIKVDNLLKIDGL